MISRLRYTFRETFDSFRRNATLTVAAIITAAISLLGVGLINWHRFAIRAPTFTTGYMARFAPNSPCFCWHHITDGSTPIAVHDKSLIKRFDTFSELPEETAMPAALSSSAWTQDLTHEAPTTLPETLKQKTMRPSKNIVPVL